MPKHLTISPPDLAPAPMDPATDALEPNKTTTAVPVPVAIAAQARHPTTGSKLVATAGRRSSRPTIRSKVEKKKAPPASSTKAIVAAGDSKLVPQPPLSKGSSLKRPYLKTAPTYKHRLVLTTFTLHLFIVGML